MYDQEATSSYIFYDHLLGFLEMVTRIALVASRRPNVHLLGADSVRGGFS
jgi:hypothetical protein